jgi:plastocyanin
MRRPFILAALASTLFAAGCGDQIIGPGGTRNIQVLDNQFSPSLIFVPRGATVRWTNNGSTMHNIAPDGGGWSSGNLAPGASYERVFNQLGTVSYRCTIHPGMTGTIEVE